MHCPKCGQQQTTEETRFCSRCGFSLTGIAVVVANNGFLPSDIQAQKSSVFFPVRRGVKQGAFLFLLSFLVVPLIAMISIALNAEPYAVFASAIILGVGGILRAFYALMFEPKELPYHLIEGVSDSHSMNAASLRSALPGSSSVPAAAYAPPTTGKWLDTNDLNREPDSVTDTTTKLLVRDQ